MKILHLLFLISFSAQAEPYDRGLYSHWSDLDRDCQDSRAEILIASSLVNVVLDSYKCRVISGGWYGSYSGNYFHNASRLDIDHIVPLKEAHISGAKNWTKVKKKAFANDPDNLIAVKISENRSKGSKDPSRWLPSDNSYHCTYISRWLSIKKKYNLEIDKLEQRTIDEVIANKC